MNIVVIINGSGTSGKDTLVSIVDKCVENTFVYNVSSIDKVREAATILGWNGNKYEHDREFLHQMKMLASKFYNHSLLYMLVRQEQMIRVYENKILGKALIGFFHVRESEEIDKFKKEVSRKCSKVLTLLVTRDNIIKFDNDADKNVEDYEYDYVIDNSGSLLDFEEKVVKLFNKIINETM